MNYQKIYQQLIFKRKVLAPLTKDSKTNPGAIETQHIIPLACNGLDTPDNKVNLTTREHFIAHLLLQRIYKGTEFEASMTCACWRMATSKRQRKFFKITSRLFEKLRMQVAIAASKRFKGKKKSISTRLKMKQPKSTIHKLHIGLANKGKKRSIENCIKNGINHKGRICVNNGIIQKMVFPDQIPDGFVKGNIKKSLANKTKIWVNNGKDEKLVDRLYIPNGFTIGRLK